MQFNTNFLLRVFKYLLLVIVLTYLIAVIVMLNGKDYDYRSKNIIEIIQDSFVFYIWSYYLLYIFFLSK